MPALLHPGVYVFEVPGGARSIEGAPTSTTIFVGETERGPLGPTKIKSRIEYERHFGGYFRSDGETVPAGDAPRRLLMPHAMDGFYLNGGSTAYVLRAVGPAAVVTATAHRNNRIVASSPGVWGNGLQVAILGASNGDPGRFSIHVVYRGAQETESRLVESFDRLSMDDEDENFVATVLQRSLYVRWKEGATFNPTPANLDKVGTPPKSELSEVKESDIVKDAKPLAGGAGGGASLPAADYAKLLQKQLAGIDDAALLVAGCDALIDAGTNAAGYQAYVDQFIGFAEGRPRQDLFFVGDLPGDRAQPDPTAATANAVKSFNAMTASNFAALYFPHVIVGDPVGRGSNPTIAVPPGGYVAGLCARIDGRRGVWKAPAGTEATLNNTIGLVHQLNDLHSDELNPKGINALRQIAGAGRVVWGARTMIPSGEWRYVPVRRTAIFLRTSIYNGIQWAVFEPNDEPLWASLRASIGGFMETQMRNGAFAGRTSAEAYFVKVDADTTTEIDQAAGVVNILVGFAPLRPAEFVVVKLSQKTQTSA